ncbi:MAG: chorismate pyruvate-lyase family protein [Rhodospirillales bacterium]
MWSSATGRDEAVLAELPPAWRLLMLSDGSATRSLTLLTGQAIAADVKESVDIAADRHAPPEIGLLEKPHLRRTVILKTRAGTIVSYAVSWWNKADYRSFLKNPALPIGTNMKQAQSEYCREICSLFLAGGAELDHLFRAEGPYLGRHYVMRHANRPLNVIVEIYAPAIAYHLDSTGWYPRWTNGAPAWNDADVIAADDNVARPDFSLRSMRRTAAGSDGFAEPAPRRQGLH